MQVKMAEKRKFFTKKQSVGIRSFFEKKFKTGLAFRECRGIIQAG